MQNGQMAERFIGREEEIALFKRWLTDSDPEAPWILHFYDKLEAQEKKGGVGKTWLLRQFTTIAKQLYPAIVIVPIDFFNIIDRDGVVVAERVVDAVRVAYPQWSPPSFTETLLEYRAAIREGKEDAAEIRYRLADALTVELRKLDERLAETRKYILMLFDTYEQAEQNPAISVLRLSQTFPDNYHFGRMGVVIAGRNAIDWKQTNWKGREHEIKEVPIAPFTPPEMLQYFDRLATTAISIPSQKAAALYERTEGRPILVGLVTDMLNNRVMSLDELVTIPKETFEGGLVTRINNLMSPIDSVIMFMAHAYHRFNFNLLDWIIRESKSEVLTQDIYPDELSRQLLSLSFVRRPSTGGDFILHDEMRALVTNYCWEVNDPNRRARKTISECVIKYYEHEIAHIQSEQLRQAYTVEMLYHKLFVDVVKGYECFVQNFTRAIDLWMSAFARSLLQEAQTFVHRMDPEQQYSMKLAEASLLQREENARDALALYKELEREADERWLVEHRRDILYQKGNCYLQLSNFAEATECFTASLEIAKEQGYETYYASLLNWLGYTQRRQGQLSTALRYYEDSIAIHKRLGNEREYANGLNSIGNVYRLQGKVEEALRRCKIGWRIRFELFKQGKISEVFVGWSLSSIGVIYLHIDDLVQAEHFFREAYDIFTRTGHKKGIASMYNRFGQIDLARGNLTQAMQSFEKAYNSSLGIDSEAQINSLNKQGWVLVLEQKWQKATEIFHRAIDLAEQIHDYYQQAESLIDLADVLERSAQHEASQRALQEAEEIGQKYSYNYLLGLAKESQGDSRYRDGEYKVAFQYYGEACRYMAYYNAVKYNKILRKTIDFLLETPEEETIPIVEALTSYWLSQGLDKDYPELINSCTELSGLLEV